MSFKPMPGVAAPGISVESLDNDGGRWSLNDAKADRFALLAFYRGHHCPVCKEQLQQLDQRVEAFGDLGVELITISANDAETAEATRRDWELKNLRIGYGLTEEQMKDWGLYASESIKPEEPEIFCEPGLFLVTTDELKLFYASITSMPFGRPDPDEMLDAVKFIVEEDYPARGTREVECSIGI